MSLGAVLLWGRGSVGGDRGAGRVVDVRVGWKHSIACAIHDGAPCSCREDAAGPLAPLFAQVRTCLHSAGIQVSRLDALAALSAIERHVQDMEMALREQAEPVMDERFRDRLLRHVLSNEEVGQLVDAIESREARARALLAGSEAEPDGEPAYCVCGNILGSENCCPEPDGGGAK